MRFRNKWGVPVAGIICLIVFLKMFYWHSQISSPFYLRNDDYEESQIRLQPHGLSSSVNKGLNFTKEQFFLDGKPITIISGAIHYFRFPRQYWEDRLLKMKACGLNTIDTYVPWNLHEPSPGKFDFKDDLDLVEFLLLAKKLKLLVILRPGPYICSEWEFGGLPSWLLRDPTMKVRTMHPPYIEAVERYFEKLLPLVKPLQYKYGGPIIAVQLDNEYGSYFKDHQYLPYLKRLMGRYDVNQFFLVSDNIGGLEKQTLPEVFKTVNFKHVDNHLSKLREIQPNAPLMVMEFWTGWFDWWGFDHHAMSLQEYGETLNEILSAKASVSFYMFFGGTNFGFMNGAFRESDVYKSDITSYDYDAPLSENGDLTPKYHKTKSIIQQYYPEYVAANSDLVFKKAGKRKQYNDLEVTSAVSLWDVLDNLPVFAMKTPVSMEMLDMNDGAGQSYGYILYRAQVDIHGKDSVVLSGFNQVFDRGSVFVNGNKVSYLTDENKNKPLKIQIKSSSTEIDLLIENGGRINWEIFDNQRKGLLGPILWDGEPITKWKVYPVEMKKDFIDNLLDSQTLWSDISTIKYPLNAPSFFQATLTINDEPLDTYIDMEGWGKGVVFINGKNLGRHWSVGPQQALYLPAPWLRRGKNSIVIFEENQNAEKIKFSAEAKLG